MHEGHHGTPPTDVGSIELSVDEKRELQEIAVEYLKQAKQGKIAFRHPSISGTVAYVGMAEVGEVFGLTFDFTFEAASRLGGEHRLLMPLAYNMPEGRVEFSDTPAQGSTKGDLPKTRDGSTIQ